VRGVTRGVGATLDFALAALRGADPERTAQRALGDGLVPVDSALGRHADPRRALDFPAAHRAVVAGLDHFDLLDAAPVAAQLHRWLS
jgi:hypothetical protein